MTPYHTKEDLVPESQMAVGRNFSRTLAEGLLKREDELDTAITDESLRLYRVGASQQLLGDTFVPNNFVRCPKTREMVIQRIVVAEIPKTERKVLWGEHHQYITGHGPHSKEAARKMGLANTKEELRERGRLSAQARGQIVYSERDLKLLRSIVNDPKNKYTEKSHGISIGNKNWSKILEAYNAQADNPRNINQLICTVHNKKLDKI